MSSGDFCPRCGDPVPEREEPLPGMPRDRDAVLCDSCYFEDFDLVDAPERIEVRVCAQCGAIHKGNRWVDVGAKDYTDVAIEEVTEALGVHLQAEDVRWGVEPEQVDQNTIRMHCTFSGFVRDTHVEETVMVPVMISRQTCKRCGRIAGGYYSSIVQIRAEDREPTKEEAERAVEIAESYIAEREATGDRNAFISEITDSGEGPNIKISTNQMGGGVAKHVVRELGGSFEEYPTLVTEDGDGNEVYRVTYAVRLPKFTPGDVIDPEDDGGPVLVRSVRGNLKGVRITDGTEYEARFEEGDAPEARRLGTVEDAEETTVVTVEDENAVQVLDPETFESKTIARPTYFDEDAATTPVLKSRAGLHILPEEAVEKSDE
ncbi:60S ribosomal export protein NMD3 [Halogeometricum limi]|uniref:Nonsense-mediated mRNA decay protein 3 n=1 Tax=Halogeometricum limi TaxID=555875 RepID=A0A1I6FSR7_9EURY|nr:60S ribosomal export protein NMD3 [Halogeometricum limi]SFR32963.1 nonsense-mediated mRNA decay protein 3 [Halogeometricum limi]